MDTLTAEEESLINEFIAITNYPAEPHTAIQFLRASDWNLERSIILYYEHSPEAQEQLNQNARRVLFPGYFPDAGGQNRPNANEQAHNQLELRATEERAREERERVQQQQQNSHGRLWSYLRAKVQSLFGANQYIPLHNIGQTGLFGLSTENQVFYFLQVVLYTPMWIFYKVSEILFVILSKLFPVLNRLTARYSQNRNSSRSEPKGIEPSHIARNFISDFNTYYRNDDRIDFFEGGYTSALYLTRRDARFLVVYLHSDEHDDTNQFVNETLLHQDTLKFFKDHNILVWGGDVHESEAYQVSNALNVWSYPFLGLLCLKSNSQETPEGTTQSAPTLTCVTRVQGLVSASAMIEKFSSQIERLEPTLIALRSERQQQELARVIREQQDQSYQASLQRDREASEQRRQAEVLNSKKQQYLRWRLATLLPEVDAGMRGEYARVAIRLLSGERVSRRFSKNASLEEIYAFTELYQKGLLNNTLEEVERPSDFIYPYDFKLISPMPRAEVSISVSTLVKDDPIVWPSGNLVMEELE